MNKLANGIKEFYGFCMIFVVFKLTYLLAQLVEPMPTCHTGLLGFFNYTLWGIFVMLPTSGVVWQVMKSLKLIVINENPKKEETK